MRSSPSVVSRSRTRLMISAGLLDSALASIATFVVGLFAIAVLEPGTLGAYALAFSAYNLLAVVPAQLVLTPLEVRMLRLRDADRLAALSESLKAGAPIAAGAAALSLLWVLAAPIEVERSAIAALAFSAAACVVVSPLQDHLRRALHIAQRSGTAALVSTVHLGAVGAGILMFLISDPETPPVWMPFGVLALANGISLCFGILVALRLRPTDQPGRSALDLRAALVSGRALLLAGLLSPASVFVAAAITSALAGAEALGYAEAARVIGQPIFVLGMGLSSVLGPRSMEAARVLDQTRTRETSRIFASGICLATVVYGAWVAGPWTFNPFARLVPAAYVFPGLAVLAVVSRATHVAVFPYRSELLGLDGERSIIRCDWWSSLVRVAVTCSAGFIHAYAIPLGAIAAGITRLPAYRGALLRTYAGTQQTASAPGVAAGA